MDITDLNSLRCHHLNYLSALGAFFHQSSSETIAKASLNPAYKVFIVDYLKMVCLPGFAKEVEEKVKLLSESKLEKSAQAHINA